MTERQLQQPGVTVYRACVAQRKSLTRHTDPRNMRCWVNLMAAQGCRLELELELKLGTGLTLLGVPSI